MVLRGCSMEKAVVELNVEQNENGWVLQVIEDDSTLELDLFVVLGAVYEANPDLFKLVENFGKLKH